MAIEVIRGAVDKPISTRTLEEYIGKLNLTDGLLYLGYPIVGNIEDVVSVDALLITKKFGLTIFDIVEGDKIENRKEKRDTLDNVLYSKLLQYKSLVGESRKLKFEVQVISIAPAWNLKEKIDSCARNEQEFRGFYKVEHIMEDAVYNKLLEAIQAVTKLKNRPKRNIVNERSRGSILKQMEESISNLDSNQNKAVIETTERIQRIRGLAGSGKTIVLALKAAYLHAKYPDWNIAVTFNSRALKEQFKDSINKFTIEQKGDEPDWNKIKILQAWGSSQHPGIYFEFCKNNNVEYYDLRSARGIEGFGEEAFDKAVEKALSEAKDIKLTYDAILIDEAQDLRESFLRMCYAILKPADKSNPYNKRLIYAYDELQKLDLNEISLRSPKEIFGNSVDFENEPRKPKQDFVLDVCYRNSKPVLVTAHALGFGIYRNEGLVQMFGEKELWKDVGYKVTKGELLLGSEVTLERDEETSPEFLYGGQDVDDLIVFKKFDNYEKQVEWIAEQIVINLKKDELQYRDIVVIYPDVIKTREKTSLLRDLLFNKKINSHLAGVSTSPDIFFQDDSIVFTSIYRAKGNEGAMVYLMDAQYCYSGQELKRKRNILFTAITRSKCWIRVCGFGDDMENLKKEYERVKSNKYTLNFKYPTLPEMDKLNLIHRDLTTVEKKTINESSTAVKVLIKNMSAGVISKEDIPEDLRNELKKLLK